MPDNSAGLARETMRFRLGPGPRHDPARWEAIGDQTTAVFAGQVVPSQRFRKDVIRLGTYVKSSEGLTFEVSERTLENWVAQFNRMAAHGVRVPIPATHQDTSWEASARDGDPRNNMGWVDRLFIENDALMMDCTLFGEDAIQAASRSDVSINSPPVFMDGIGRTYMRPITHVAMVTDPVVPGLGEFVPLAASLNSQDRSPMMLEFLKQLAGALGLDPAAISDETAGTKAIMDAIAALLEKLKQEPSTVQASEKTEPAAEPAQGGAVKKETVTREYAASLAGEPQRLLVRLATENRSMKLNALAAEGRITPAQRDKLVKDWATPEAVTLTLSAGRDGEDFERLLEVLRLAEPVVRMGEKTGPQTVALSDSRKSTQPENPVVANAEARAQRFQDRMKSRG